MKLVKSVLSASILAAAAQTAVAVEITPYAGIQVHYIFEDSAGPGGDGGIEDSYSRAGIKLSEQVGDINLTAKVEYAVDPTGETDFENDETHLRAAVLTASGDFGSIGFGKDFLPFYNAITWGVGSDRFYGYYTGYEADFISKTSDTIFYSSPDINGLNITASISGDSASKSNTSNQPNHKEIALTYTVDENLTVAAAFGDGDTAAHKRRGAGLRYAKGEWLTTINYQENPDAATPETWINAYTQYSIDDKNTFRAHIGDDDAEGTTPYTLGFSHSYNDDLTVFAEYYDNDTGGEYPSIGFHYNL